jgi:hypothetical protein
MAKFVKLLGFAAAGCAPSLREAMASVAGPPVGFTAVGSLAVLWQKDAARVARRAPGRDAMRRALQTVQRRLEAACPLAAFLPADPAQCRCPEADIATLLADAMAPVGAALAGAGACHQWDVVLRWQAEAVVAAHRTRIAATAAPGPAGLAASIQSVLAQDRAMREAALRAALAPVTLALAATGASETETGLTCLLPAGAEAALEQALAHLPPDVTDGASADLRGPLPPLSFAAVRVACTSAGELAQAWRALALPDWIDADGLRRRWHDCAGRLHPDHGADDQGEMAAAGAAFRLLRGLLPAEAPAQTWTLAALQQRGARRLLVPAP